MFAAIENLTGLTTIEFEDLHVSDQVDFLRWITLDCLVYEV